MDEPVPSDPRRPWAGRVAGLVALIGLYRLLVGSDDPLEWAAAAIAAMPAMAGVVAVSGRLSPATIRPAWALNFPGLIPRMFAEAVRVALSALRVERPAGTFDVVPVDPGGDAASTGRRGLVIARASLAPNSLVVTLDRANRAMLVHRLLPDRASSGDREWPL